MVHICVGTEKIFVPQQTPTLFSFKTTDYCFPTAEQNQALQKKYLETHITKRNPESRLKKDKNLTTQHKTYN